MIITLLLLLEEEERATLLVPIKAREAMSLHHFEEGADEVGVEVLMKNFPLIFGDDPEKMPEIKPLSKHGAILTLPNGRWAQLATVVTPDIEMIARLESAGYEIIQYDLERNHFPPDALTRAAVAAFFAACEQSDVEDEGDDELTN